MRISILGAAAAVAPFMRVSAAPAGLLDVAVLGGNTFRAPQVESTSFISGSKRGVIALASAYSKFNVALSDELLQLIEEILEELGLLQPNGSAGSGSTNSTGSIGNDTVDAASGMKDLSC